MNTTTTARATAFCAALAVTFTVFSGVAGLARHGAPQGQQILVQADAVRDATTALR